MQADAAALRVPSTQCIKLQTCEAWPEPSRLQCLAHTARRVWAPLAKHAFSPRSSGGRPSRGSGKRSRRTCMLPKLAIQRANYPIAAACTTAHHQGSEPQKEACLIHRRHARRAPAPDVLIERRCRVERPPAARVLQTAPHISHARRAAHRSEAAEHHARRTSANTKPSEAEHALCAVSAVQQQSRMRPVASAVCMKGKHRRRPRQVVITDAAAMQADVAARRVPSTQ